MINAPEIVVGRMLGLEYDCWCVLLMGPFSCVWLERQLQNSTGTNPERKQKDSLDHSLRNYHTMRTTSNTYMLQLPWRYIQILRIAGLLNTATTHTILTADTTATS